MFHENDVNFSGFATQPEKRGDNENQVCAFSIANTKTYKDAQGEYQETTTFLKCVAFGKLAENMNKTLSKGDLIKVKGELMNNTWETQEGQKRSEIELKVGQFYIVSTKEERDQLKELRKKE